MESIQAIICEEINKYLNDNFWTWFRGSKVVNPDGSPKKVYHGTKADFSEFDKKYRSFYFSEKPEYASGFAIEPFGKGGDNPSVLPVYLKITRPLDLSAANLEELSSTEFMDVLYSKGVEISETHIKSYKFDYLPVWQWLRTNNHLVFPEIQNSGYDGIIMYEAADLSTGERISSKAYMVFDQTSIKSATGNQGGFDSLNPDITTEDINEVGEGSATPYPWKLKHQRGNTITYGFTTEDRDVYEIGFTYYQSTWFVDFMVENGSFLDIVNKGRVYQVMATVGEVLKDFMAKHDPELIKISPAKTPEDNRRFGIYMRYVETQLPSGYEVLADDKYIYIQKI